MTCLFYDNETGEEFFVERENEKECKDIAKLYFNEPVLIDVVSEEYAEWLGLDTY